MADATSFWAFVFSLSGAIVFLIGGALIAWKGKNWGFPKWGTQLGAIVAVLGLLGTVYFGGGLSGLSTTSATAVTAEFTVTASEETEQSQVTIDDASNTVQVNLQYDISDANYIGGTGFAEVNFTIGRADTSTADTTTTTDILTIAQVADDDGSGKTYPIVSKNADGTYKWNCEKGANASPSTTNKYATLLVEGGSTNFIRLNITFNPTAGGEMIVYDSESSTFTVAGETWQLLAVLVVKQA